MRVYLDNCCYNRPFDDQSQPVIHIETQAKLEIQEQIRKGKLELATSYILEAENVANPFAQKRADIQAFINQYTHVFVSRKQDETVRRMATDIMARGIHLMDACHIACAVLAECDVFLSTDKRVLKYQTEAIRMMNPAVFFVERGDLE